MEACSLLVNLRKGMQSSSEQPLVGEERYVTTLITAVKETIRELKQQTFLIHGRLPEVKFQASHLLRKPSRF